MTGGLAGMVTVVPSAWFVAVIVLIDAIGLLMSL